MATVTLGTGMSIDMTNLHTIDGYVLFADSSEIKIGFGPYETDYVGLGFTYDTLGNVVGGTLTGIWLSQYGIPTVASSGLNVPAATAYQLVGEDRWHDLLATALSGNDTINAWEPTDVLEGFGGNDTLVGQPGGSNIAVFSGVASQYSITETRGGYVVSGPDGTDSLISIAAARFADQTVSLVPPDLDVGYYLAHNPDVAAARVDPVAHFMFQGWLEGRNPNAFFDTRFYLNQNPDVAASGMNPLLHYEQHGWREGRDPSLNFSTHAYLQANPDVATAAIDPLEHYLHHGQFEGRMAFISTPHGVGPQDPLVDNSYYFGHNQDVAAAGMSPFTHYDQSGWHEGRNPDGWFDTNYYLSHNPDVAAAHIDPMLHYEQFGWREGRDPSAQFSTEKYLGAYGDVRAAGVDPLVHFLQHGISEGRTAFHV